MNVETIDKVRQFLTVHSTMTLSTVSADGLPQSAALFFAADDNTLVFISGPKSRHTRNIAATGKAAVTVHNEVWSWNDIAGMQMEGDVNLIPTGPARERAWEVYRAKFPFIVEFEADVSTSEFYRFAPKWVRLIDNRIQFGHIEEITVPLSRQERGQR